MDQQCDWISELSNILGKAEYDSHKLNTALDKLIVDLHYKTTSLQEKKDISCAVTTCCKKLPSENALLVAKTCNLLYNVTLKQKIHFDNEQLSVIVSWLSNAIKNLADITFLDILQVTNVLIKNHGDYLSKESEELLSALLINLENKTAISDPAVVKLSRLTCLKALIPYSQNNKHNDIARALFDAVYTLNTDKPDTQAKIWICVIESFDSLCLKGQEWLGNFIDDLVGLIITVSHLGFDTSGLESPKPSFPSSVTVPPQVHPTSGEVKAKAKTTVQIKKFNKVKQVNWINKQNDCEPEDNTVFRANVEVYNTRLNHSESDQSDSETGQGFRTAKLQARGRHAAFNLLIQTVQTTFKVYQSLLTAMIPICIVYIKLLICAWEDYSLEMVIGTRPLYGHFALLIGKLTNNLKRETFNKPKIAALAAVTALLASSKNFLAQAQHREGGSFTTFSESLAQLLSNLHTTLGQLLKSCTQSVVIAPLLHTTAALISVSPYKRLMPSLLTNIFRIVQSHIGNKDPGVMSGVLLCTTEIVILTPVSKEQSDILTAGSVPNEPCWPFTHCVNILKNPECEEAPKFGAWQLLSGLCQCHYGLIKNHISILESFILKDLGKLDDSKYQYHVAKTLDYLLDKLLYDDEMLKYKRELWIKLIKGPLIPLAQTSTKITSIACDCLSSMGPQVYHTLPEDLQILVITLAIGCCYNDHSGVRAAAINTLGIFLLFPQQISEQFVHDSKDILINALKDSNDLVRSRAAWSYGNLIELLKDKNRDLLSEISLRKLFEAGMVVIEDNQKVKANILRAMANLMLLVTEKDLDNNELKIIIIKCANFFVFCATTGKSMKMRWNACFAIGTMLTNELLYSISNDWLGSIIQNLCFVLLKCGNFKVRINACSALVSIKSRRHFTPYYHFVVTSLLDGLENAANMTDFREFKHQDDLKQKLCYAVCHVISLAVEEDIDELSNAMDYRFESLKTNIEYFMNFAPPERTSVVLSAANNIANLKAKSSTSSHSYFLNLLQKSFEIVSHEETY